MIIYKEFETKVFREYAETINLNRFLLKRNKINSAGRVCVCECACEAIILLSLLFYHGTLQRIGGTSLKGLKVVVHTDNN